MRLDTRYIDTFLAVLETGGITRAAEQPKNICYNQVYAVTPANMTMDKTVINLIERIKSLT